MMLPTRSLRSLLAMTLAGLLAASPPQVYSAVPGDSSASALVALCRVWNAVRFFHPALTSETDGRWDDALMAALPDVERDPGALQTATAAMLGTLDDPLTRVAADPGPQLVATPSVEIRDGVRSVRLNGYPSQATLIAYRQALQSALSVTATDKALLVDLRMPGAAGFGQITLLRTMWARVFFAAHLTTEPLTMPLVADRYLVGFPPETGTTSGDYREGRETTSPLQTKLPAADSRRVPVAFVVDRTAVVPDEALALERSGAVVFSSDATPGILSGEAQLVDAGEGLKILLRMGAPLNGIVPRSGDLEAAVAWTRNSGTAPQAQPRAPSANIAERYASTTLPDDAHRVLATFRMWGTIAYADPYKSLMHDDWDAALVTGIHDVRAADSSLAYELALMRFYAHIHDTHGYISGPAMRNAYAAMPAFLAREVEGHSTIVRVDPAAAKRDGFAVGDVIESIDGEPAQVREKRLRPYINASTEQSSRDILETESQVPSLFAGRLGSMASLRLRGAGGLERNIRTPRVAQQQKLFVRTRPVVAILAGNLGYVDLQRLSPADVEKTVRQLEHTRAIVFDLRGYPRGTAWSLAPHFTGTTVRAALFRTPVRRTPLSTSIARSDGEYVDETRDFYTLIEPSKPRLAQPVVVVIDVRAISQSEYTALYLAAAAHARFVGEPTTGADGDVTTFLLPGAVTANFSGQAVLHPDGRQTQRIGIVPDLRTSPTLHGIRAGDDEVLKAGLREALTLAHVDAATQRVAIAAEDATEHADAIAQRRVPPPPSAAILAANAVPLPEDAFVTRGPGYVGGPDSSVRHVDGRTIALRAKPDTPGTPFGAYAESAFGSYAASFPLEHYPGKRVRVSGYLRTSDAANAAFWLRVDGPNGVEAFDNMSGRALIGTTGWTPFAIVLDVPDDAQQLVGGLLLTGHRGNVWADDLHIDTVNSRVASTAM